MSRQGFKVSPSDLNILSSQDFSVFTASKTVFTNPFTGETEEYISERDANHRMLEAAAKRIADLQAEVDAIKAFLVL